MQNTKKVVYKNKFDEFSYIKMDYFNITFKIYLIKNTFRKRVISR